MCLLLQLRPLLQLLCLQRLLAAACRRCLRQIPEILALLVLRLSWLLKRLGLLKQMQMQTSILMKQSCC